VISQVFFSFIVWSFSFTYLFQPSLWVFRVPTRFGWKVGANAIWSLKGIKGSHLFILVIFFHQKISIALQRIQASSILSQAIVIGLVTS
jgi:hypothetical protein